MNESQAIFELIALVIAPPLTIFVGGIIRNFFKSTLDQELNRQFHKYWDGQTENELYAWQMVKNQILNSTRDPIRLKKVENYILEAKRLKDLSNLKIDNNGKLLF